MSVTILTEWVESPAISGRTCDTASPTRRKTEKESTFFICNISRFSDAIGTANIANLQKILKFFAGLRLKFFNSKG